MPHAVRRVSYCLTLALCASAPLAYADLYKCKNAQGNVTFSGTPCAADATKIVSPTVNTVSSTAPASAAQTPATGLVGKWRSGNAMTYEFKADGSLRTDEVHSDFKVWRTGRWKLEGQQLHLSFDKIGGSVRDESFSAEESGPIEWDEDKQSFRFEHDNYWRVR